MKQPSAREVRWAIDTLKSLPSEYVPAFIRPVLEAAKTPAPKRTVRKPRIVAWIEPGHIPIDDWRDAVEMYENAGYPRAYHGEKPQGIERARFYATLGCGLQQPDGSIVHIHKAGLEKLYKLPAIHMEWWERAPNRPHYAERASIPPSALPKITDATGTLQYAIARYHLDVPLSDEAVHRINDIIAAISPHVINIRGNDVAHTRQMFIKRLMRSNSFELENLAYYLIILYRIEPWRTERIWPDVPYDGLAYRALSNVQDKAFDTWRHYVANGGYTLRAKRFEAPLGCDPDEPRRERISALDAIAELFGHSRRVLTYEIEHYGAVHFAPTDCYVNVGCILDMFNRVFRAEDLPQPKTERARRGFDDTTFEHSGSGDQRAFYRLYVRQALPSCRHLVHLSSNDSISCVIPTFWISPRSMRPDQKPIEVWPTHDHIKALISPEGLVCPDGVTRWLMKVTYKRGDQHNLAPYRISDHVHEHYRLVADFASIKNGRYKLKDVHGYNHPRHRDNYGVIDYLDFNKHDGNTFCKYAEVRAFRERLTELRSRIGYINDTYPQLISTPIAISDFDIHGLAYVYVDGDDKG